MDSVHPQQGSWRIPMKRMATKGTPAIGALLSPFWGEGSAALILTSLLELDADNSFEREARAVKYEPPNV